MLALSLFLAMFSLLDTRPWVVVVLLLLFLGGFSALKYFTKPGLGIHHPPPPSLVLIDTSRQDKKTRWGGGHLRGPDWGREHFGFLPFSSFGKTSLGIYYTFLSQLSSLFEAVLVGLAISSCPASQTLMTAPDSQEWDRISFQIRYFSTIMSYLYSCLFFPPSSFLLQ